MIVDLADEPNGLPLDVDVAIVGAGAAGITLALELQGSGLTVALFEGGRRRLTRTSQDRYTGPLSVDEGMEYPPLDAWRLRYLGGTTNHWGGWCRPLDPHVFEPRPGTIDEGWPFDRSSLDAAYSRAQQICQLGREEWDVSTLCTDAGLAIPVTSTDTLAPFAWRISPPTRFGEEYGDDLATSDVTVVLGANCVGLDIEDDRVTGVRLATDDGRPYSVSARQVVLACGGIENVRQLLLAVRAGHRRLAESGTLGAGFMELPHVPVGQVLCEAGDTDPEGRLASMLGNVHDSDGTRFKVALGVTAQAQADRQMANVSYSLFNSAEPPPATRHGDAVRALWGSTRTGDTAELTMFARTEQRVNPQSRVSLSTDIDDLGVVLRTHVRAAGRPREPDAELQDYSAQHGLVQHAASAPSVHSAGMAK